MQTESPIPITYLDTDGGSYVLTLYEHHSDDEIDYMLGLQQHLAARSMRCSSPVLPIAAATVFPC